MPNTSSAPDRASGPAPTAPQTGHVVLLDGRPIANLGQVYGSVSDRDLMNLAVDAIPDQMLARARHLEVRNGAWKVVVPVRGTVATVIRDGVRLLHLNAQLHLIRDRQADAACLRLRATSRTTPRRGARARGAGRPRGRRSTAASRSSGSSSGDDGPSQPEPPLGGSADRHARVTA
jgi:hypothetical protein